MTDYQDIDTFLERTKGVLGENVLSLLDEQRLLVEGFMACRDYHAVDYMLSAVMDDFDSYSMVALLGLSFAVEPYQNRLKNFTLYHERISAYVTAMFPPDEADDLLSGLKYDS